MHQPGRPQGEQQDDPGATSPVQGYAAPLLLAADPHRPEAGGLLDDRSGLRIFDISDLAHPSEVGYFNKPMASGTKPANPEAQGGYAMSQPAWDVARGQVWYTDGNCGFYDVPADQRGRTPPEVTRAQSAAVQACLSVTRPCVWSRARR